MHSRNHPATHDASGVPLAYTFADAARAAGVSKTRLHHALAAGELTARKHGRRTIVEAEELRRWIASWPVAQFGAGRRRKAA